MSVTGSVGFFPFVSLPDGRQDDRCRLCKPLVDSGSWSRWRISSDRASPP